ncbi:Acetyl esterase/lipase [Pseudarthrobacter enclensis]|uniref:Esterase n=1 Tax=Pseudarthrobacter enclensis TaxID=993070 RepID=A0A0V8IMT8_9MICC|nr:alpha/beta hydrolase [Pseudarthrobacter enclensis]KSU76078.1 esterase [Pseudarthrobacter enclensis]SCC11272.1 Acetyl esterase/lipase [Pseudarthrobacter enclensis]
MSQHAVHRHHYGPDPSQWGELFLPDLVPGTRHQGVVVVIHGGYWRSTYGAELGEPLARDLAEHGMAAWNLEYRRAGNGGGWPATFDDVLAGIDHLAVLADSYPLDLRTVVALGHSAGGHLAVWAAGRDRPAGVRLTGVVSQSGVLDLAEAERLHLSDGAVANLLGGPSSEFPGRHRDADPMAALPLEVSVYAVHAEADQDVPSSMSTRYVQASLAGSVPARLVTVPGDHFSLIDTTHPAYATCRELVRGLLR